MSLAELKKEAFTNASEVDINNLGYQLLGAVEKLMMQSKSSKRTLNLILIAGMSGIVWLKLT